jgi:hypothetical protein
MAETNLNSSSVFGDDINATPVSKLNVPSMVVTSRKDADAAGGKLEMPVYNPDQYNTDNSQQNKSVRFDETPSVREIPRREYSNEPPQRQPQRQRQVQRQRQPQPQPTPPPRRKRQSKKIFRMLARYSHALIVLALVVIALWYHARVVAAAPSFLSNGRELTMLGIAVAGVGTATMYGVVEHVVDN